MRRAVAGALALCCVGFAGTSAAGETSLWSGPPAATSPRANDTDFPGAVTGGAAAPGASAWSDTAQARVRLVASESGVGTAPSLRLGLQFLLQPHWKIYWRSPGAAGYPPRLDWAGSTNLAGATIAWPAPRRFSVLGLDTMGYENEVVLPIEVRPARPGQALALKTKVDYLVCREICVPYTAVLALDIPAGPADATRFAHLIDRYQAQVPGDGTASGLGFARVAIAGTSAAPVLQVTATAREPFARPDLFVEGPSEFAFAAPKLSLDQGGHRAVLRLAVTTAGRRFPDLTKTPLTLTLVDGNRSIEARATPVAAPAESPWTGLPAMLLLAVLGGLILNLMPCVLPVLSLKLLGLVGHGGGERRAIRWSFLASAGGVVAAFLVLAAGTVGLKLAGHAIGWGIQFQQPAFLTALALVCMAFAANLWGLYEIRLPGFLADRVARGGHDHGVVGPFLTGAFATVLATPCSAPFLGTAVGFALARGPAQIVAIFAALGLGMALPYLAVAARPGLAQRLPRPGRWMIVLKQVLGIALAGTAAWLVSVLVGELGLRAALAVGATVAAIPLVVWAIRRWPDYTRRSGPAALIALVVLAFGLPDRIGAAPDTRHQVADLADWQPFAAAEIPTLVAAGKVVFVDVTADWCITCQANRTLVLDRAPVAGWLDRPDVVRMVADWTRPSDQIAGYLASFGRYGIPFNAVYGPGAPAGVPLPELLSAKAVEAALAKARAPGRAAASGRAAEAD